MLSEDEINEYVYDHQRWVDERIEMWHRFNLAYSSKFWEGGDPWGGRIPTTGEYSLPIRIQTNRIFGMVQRYTSHLYFRNPRAEIGMPGVIEARGPGRPPNLDGVPAKVTGLLNEWLMRSDAQEAGTYALQLALFHGASAYKISENPRAKRVVDKLGVSVVPRWDVLWDDYETSFDQQLYRGHLQYKPENWVKERYGDQFVQDTDLVPLPGQFGLERDYQHRLRPRKYVRLLEFYDMTMDKGGTGGCQRIFKLIGTRGTPGIVEIFQGPLPYPLPNGRPGVPLVPIVLAHEPSRPLSGLSTVERMYWFNAELNLLLTIIANAMRRDACRYTFVHKGLLTPEAIAAFRNAEDGSVIELDPKIAPDLSKVLQVFKQEQFGGNLDKYRQWLFDEEAATSGISDIMSGKQGNYLSATEAELLASSGEASALEVGSRLTQSMARLTELACAAFAAAGKELKVRLPSGEYETLTPDELDEPWVVDIVDAASTPMRMAKKQTGFLAVQKILLDLVAIASSPEDIQQPDGTSIPNPITPEQRQEAKGQIEYIVTQWDLPDTLGWELISGQGDEARTANEEERVGKVKKLLEFKVAQQNAQMAANGPALPAPTLPAMR